MPPGKDFGRAVYGRVETMPDAMNPGLDALLEHRSWVRDLARRLVRDAADAEDLAQETWVRVLRSPPDPDRDPRPWLRRVLKNLASNRWRGERRRTERETAWRDARTQKTPVQLVAEADQHQRLVQRVLELEEPFKTTLVLRFYEGLSPRDIGERLGIAEGTVHSRVARAVERLRDRLDEEAGGDRKQWLAALLPLARWDGAASTVATTATTATTIPGVLVMFTKSKLALATVLALAAVAAGGVWLAADTDPDADDASRASELALRIETPRDPTLLGTGRGLREESASGGDREALQPSTGHALAGRVTDERGEAIAGVEVFVLPDGVDGVEEEVLQSARLPFARTDGEGAFRLLSTPSDGRVVAFVEGRLPASFDLHEVDSSQPVDLVLPEPRTITVRVEDPDGHWPARCRVGLQTDPDQTFERTADPTRLWFWGNLDALEDPTENEQSIRVPTQAPVMVGVSPPRGWAALPRSLRLEAEADRAVFRLVPSGVLHVSVIDALTGEAFHDGLRASVGIEDLPDEVLVTNRSHLGSEYHFDDRLAPGSYRVTVTASGYRPESREFEVTSTGQRTDLVVALEPRYAADLAGVSLRVTDLEQASEAARGLAHSGSPKGFTDEYEVLIRRSGTTQWRDTSSRLGSGGRIDLRPSVLDTKQEGFAPGTYDLYVARRDTATAAFLPGLRVFGGQENEFAVTLTSGSLFRVTDLVSPADVVTSFEVHAAGIGALPSIHWSRDGHTTITTPEDTAALVRRPLEPRVLGPYPATEVVVTLRMESGETKTARVRGTTIFR